MSLNGAHDPKLIGDAAALARHQARSDRTSPAYQSCRTAAMFPPNAASQAFALRLRDTWPRLVLRESAFCPVLSGSAVFQAIRVLQVVSVVCSERVAPGVLASDCSAQLRRRDKLRDLPEAETRPGRRNHECFPRGRQSLRVRADQNCLPKS